MQSRYRANRDFQIYWVEVWPRVHKYVMARPYEALKVADWRQVIAIDMVEGVVTEFRESEGESTWKDEIFFGIWS